MSTKFNLRNSENLLQLTQKDEFINLTANQNLQNQEEDLSHSVNSNKAKSQIISQNNLPKPFKNSNSCFKELFLRKLDIKDKSNSYYKKGVYNIFNNENYFLENKYDDKLVVVNQKHKPTQIREYLYINGKIVPFRNLNYNKKRQFKQNNSVDSYNNEGASTSMRSGKIIKNFIKTANFINENKVMEGERDSFFVYGNNQNSPQNDGKNDKFILRNTLNKAKASNLLGKRLPVFYLGKTNNVTDGELNVLYNKIHERVERNHNKEILSLTLNSDKLKKVSPDKNLNKILSLQEKILLDSKTNNKSNQKILKRVLKYTNKEKKNLLINQSQNYRLKREIINETTVKKNNEQSRLVKWLISLRNYKNNKNECIHKNNSMINIHYNPFDVNYDKKENNNLYYDFSKPPLYPLIFSHFGEQNEKLVNSYCNNDNDDLKKNSNNFYVKKKLEENDRIKDLKINGKNLLKHEIEMSKYLEGKRKKLINNKYQNKEIKDKVFVKSYSFNNLNFPKAVSNTMNLHLENNV